LSTQSNRGWHDQNPDLRTGTQALLKEGEREDYDIGQGNTMVLLNLLIKNRLLGQKWSENQVII